jgi:hypothetical protein
MTLSALELQVRKVTGGLEPPLVPLTRRVRCQLRHVTERPRGDSNSRFLDLQSRTLPAWLLGRRRKRWDLNPHGLWTGHLSKVLR